MKAKDLSALLARTNPDDDVRVKIAGEPAHLELAGIVAESSYLARDGELTLIAEPKA